MIFTEDLIKKYRKLPHIKTCHCAQCRGIFFKINKPNVHYGKLPYIRPFASRTCSRQCSKNWYYTGRWIEKKRMRK